MDTVSVYFVHINLCNACLAYVEIIIIFAQLLSSFNFDEHVLHKTYIVFRFYFFWGGVCVTAVILFKFIVS